MTVIQKSFGQRDGQAVNWYTLKNDRGFQVSCINYGCIITEIIAPDQEGKMENVVLGFDSLEEYEKDVHFLGAVAGRFAGRIKHGEVELEGRKHLLDRNSNGQHLHGGGKGFHAVMWDAEIVEDGVEFTYLSPDGEEGYPGNLEMKVRYSIKNDADELVISYSGKTDATTLLNVTNHSYFNLSGDLKRDVLEHELTLPSDKFLELDGDLLPTGEMVPVDGTVFDLRNGRTVREAVASDHPQTQLAGNGYDHPFLLNKTGGAIVLKDPASGRKLQVETTEPAVVLYTGNGLGGSYSIRGTEARDNLGLCLETQSLPDSPRHSHFGSSVLKAGEEFFSETKYLFGVTEG